MIDKQTMKIKLSKRQIYRNSVKQRLGSKAIERMTSIGQAAKARGIVITLYHDDGSFDGWRQDRIVTKDELEEIRTSIDGNK